MKTLDFKILNDYFRLDSNVASGLVWNKDIMVGKNLSTIRIKAGTMAGSFPKGHKYWVVLLKRQHYLVHRIIMTLSGFDCNHLNVDHIDGNSANNDINNLRLVSTTQNNRNKTMDSRNSTGITGVYLYQYKSGGFFWVGQYYNNFGKLITKSFSISKYGEELAKELATNFRDSGIVIAGDYSERHGK